MIHRQREVISFISYLQEVFCREQEGSLCRHECLIA
jgi:hypothetical protein